jgi:hypothetical protein
LGHKNNDPHQKLESLERWSARATLLILVGIIIEIGLILWFPHDRWERLGSATANALVGIGLIVEYVVILRAIVASGDADRSSNERIAASEARAAEANERTAEAVLETARAGWLNALAVNASVVAMELIAFTGKLRDRESLSDSARVLLIDFKFETFAGKRFDAAITFRDLGRETFLRSLASALTESGWIDVGVTREQSDGKHASTRDVRIDVDASKDPTLLDAAKALASALNAEGIAAVVNPKPESDATKANVIHILVGPKASREPSI